MNDFKEWLEETKLYFRQDIPINDNIVLKQPTIGQIVEFGEARYFGMARTLTTIPSDIKPELFDMGIDYEEIGDFELFCMLSGSLTRDDTYLLLGEVDLSKFELYRDPANDEMVLYDTASETIIDRRIHMMINHYICKLHGFTQKVEHAANKYTKKILIEDDRQRKAMRAKKPYESQLLPIISSLVNSPGFKYCSKDVLNIGIYELMDSLKRTTVLMQTSALLQGMYSGNIDTTKLDKKDLDWTRPI